MCSKILLLRSPCTSSTAPLSIQLATITTRSQLPTDRKIGQIRGICCSQGGMGRKKGELSQKSGSQNKSKGSSAPTCQDSSGTQAAGSPLQLDKTGSSTLISIAAKPGAKHSSVTHLSEESVGVAIGAAAVDGAANTELVAFLASVLKVKKSAISLESGARGRRKVVKVAGLSPLQVEALLQATL